MRTNDLLNEKNQLHQTSDGERMWDRDIKIINTVRRISNRRKVDEILDLGCGDGSLTIMLKKVSSAETVWGVDIDNGNLESASSKGIRVLNLNLDHDKLKFQSESFDMVTCLDVIYYLGNPDLLLEEIRRILKPKGIFILALRNLGSWTNRAALLFGAQPYYLDVSLKFSLGKLFAKGKLVYGGFVRGFTLRGIKKLLQAYGFKTRRVLGYREPNMPGFLAPWDLFFCRFPSLASGMILTSMKCELNGNDRT